MRARMSRSTEWIRNVGVPSMVLEVEPLKVDYGEPVDCSMDFGIYFAPRLIPGELFVRLPRRFTVLFDCPCGPYYHASRLFYCATTFAVVLFFVHPVFRQ